MRMLRTIAPVLLALVLVGGSLSTIGAQEDEPFQIDDLEGLETAYSRTFSAAAFDSATPGAATGGWLTLGAIVFEFDTEDHAAAGLDLLMTEIQETGFAGDGSPVEDAELDIEIDHVAKRDVLEDGMWDTTILVGAARDEATVALVAGVVIDADPAPAVGSTLTAIMQTDTSDEAETFREDGTSEGGLWARFPSLERVQAEVPALIEVGDETPYPVPSVAASTPARVQVEPVGTPAG